MDVIAHDITYQSRGDAYTILPIGDVHIGAVGCDEELLQATVERIRADSKARWIGMGDYCNFINRSDPRFSVSELADWIKVKTLGDLVKAQRERFVKYIKPIANKCLALLEGNHETAIAKHYERNVYSEIVTAVKEAGGFADDDKLGLGYSGWLELRFHRRTETSGTSTVRFNLHHGFGGSRLAGGKALNMQRWLWTHDADVVLFGHTHNMSIQSEVVESLTTTGQIVHRKRLGAVCGSYVKPMTNGESSYAEIKGYLPQGTGGVEIVIKPSVYGNNGARFDENMLQLRTA